MRIKKLLLKYFLFLLSLLITCCLLEVALRLIIGTSSLSHQRNESDFIQYNSEVNYIYKKNFQTFVTTKDYKINVSINSFGYRDEEWKFNRNKNNILVLGNSVSAGFGLDVSKRWSDIFERLINSNLSSNSWEVYNAAVSGYSLEQMSITADLLLPTIKPKIVILGLNIAALNRLIDPYIYFKGFSIRKSKICYARIYNDELYIHHFKIKIMQRLEYLFLKNSVLYNYIASLIEHIKNRMTSEQTENGEIIQRAKNIIFNLKNKIRMMNIDLIVLPIIQHTETKQFDPLVLRIYTSFKKYLKDNDVEMIDILPVFKENIERGNDLWIKTDPHWNENAHRIAAKILYKRLANIPTLAAQFKPQK